MRAFLYSKCCCILLCCCLASLLVACSPTSSSQPLSHAAATPSSIPTQPAPTTAPVPPTQTSCPADGTARPLVTAPLVMGNHPTIVYATTELSADNRTVIMGTLKRYDVTTGSTTVIVQIPNMQIDEAQVSPDGQWVLYALGKNPVPATMMQAVRIDGQGQQTLFCSTDKVIDSLQWSPDQKQIAFYNRAIEGSGFATSGIRLLNIAHGTLQTVFPDSISAYTAPHLTFHSWLDATHLYLYHTYYGYNGHPVPPDDIYVLDITKGANQQQSDLFTAMKGSYGGFESSYDRSQVYINSNKCDQRGCKPPSTIVALPAMGGTPHTLWQNTQDGIFQACPVNSHQLLVQIGNISGPGGDTSNNGNWVMNSDGTGLTRLATDDTGNSGFIGDCSYTWNNASRDGHLYVVQISNAEYKNSGLAFAKLDGSGPLTLFAPTTGQITARVIGWTTM
jgi:dipeptidyl aminopeptidase/acylaminoacyl peptidase